MMQKADERKYVALYGGSFDPPHNGHVLSISHLLNSDQVAEVWIVPSGDSRYDKMSVESAAHRWALLEVLHKNVFRGDSRIQLVNIQLQEEFADSTAITLVREIRRRGEDRPLAFVVGRDNIGELESWKEFEALRKEVCFLVVPRLGEQCPEPIPPYVRLLSKEHLASCSISSSDLRQRIRRGDVMAGYMPTEILDEVQVRCLYGMESSKG